MMYTYLSNMSATTCKCAERCVVLLLLVCTISLFYRLIGKGPVIFKYGLRKESRSENKDVIISCKYSELHVQKSAPIVVS